MTKVETKVEIEVSDRMPGTKDVRSSTKVYFFHEGESVLEGFGNRVARPKDLYKTYLGDVADKMGVPRTTKFSWSQKAGCRCGCSPGFTCREVKGKDVFVTLTGVPKTNDNPEDLAKAVNRLQQLGFNPVSREEEDELTTPPETDGTWDDARYYEC